MPWTTDDIPDLSGRTAVVTGANGGLGLETARALAGAGAHVVMAARNQEKAALAQDDILGTTPDASLELVPLDLASLDSVRSASDAILTAHETVDILVNNAGLMAIAERRTEDGFEMQFGVNHLGHWALTALLLPAILRASSARVVTVTSVAHHLGRPVDPTDPHLDDGYGPWKAYNQSKLANFHFALGLERELRRTATSAMSLLAHPGASNTHLQTRSVAESGGGLTQKLSLSVVERMGMTPARGALSQLRAATDPAARGGEFYGPLFVSNGPPVKKPVLRRFDLDRGIQRLWQVSEAETGISLDVTAAAGR